MPKATAKDFYYFFASIAHSTCEHLIPLQFSRVIVDHASVNLAYARDTGIGRDLSPALVDAKTDSPVVLLFMSTMRRQKPVGTGTNNQKEMRQETPT